MLENGYIFTKDSKRIFINPTLGCHSHCSYCYLPKFNFKEHKIISLQEILAFLKENKIEQNKDTLITLGCFCECWSVSVKERTIEIINYFLKQGNQVQVSTKKEIKEKDLEMILPNIQYKGQLIFFISCVTISSQKEIEKNTSSIKERMNSFKTLKKHQIPAVLYIKPFLEQITSKDIEKYKEYITKYAIQDVIVGSIYTEEETKEKIHFSEKVNLYYKENQEEQEMINALSSITHVERRSSDIMKKYQRKTIRIE